MRGFDMNQESLKKCFKTYKIANGGRRWNWRSKMELEVVDDHILTLKSELLNFKFKDL